MTDLRPPLGLPPILAEVVDEATGRRHRADPVRPGSGGPAGNGRLTAWTGLILLLVVVAQLFTLLDVDHLISWHVAIGTILLVLALVKTGSVSWRIARYYRHQPDYRQGGPPPLLLRLLGPLVVLTTFALVGSGLVLVALGPRASRQSAATLLGFRLDWLTVHQGVFIVFAVVVGLHLLARIVPALRLTVIPRLNAPTVHGGRMRLGVLVLASLVAAGSATIVVTASHDWQTGHGYGSRPSRSTR